MSHVAPLSQLLIRWVTGQTIPSRCEFCGTWPTHPSGHPWCKRCGDQWGQPVKRCLQCAIRLDAPGRVCGQCLTTRPALTSCCAAVDYGFPWSDIVLKLKREHGSAWAKPMAGLMWPAIQEHFGVNLPDVWAPIPLHTHKLKIRGHNQAWELTRALARCAVKAGAPNPRLAPHLLRRIHEGHAQHHLHHAQRWANVRDSFELDTMPDQPKSVLLIDDVFTTGATLRAATERLNQQGLTQIHGAVFARTPRHHA